MVEGNRARLAERLELHASALLPDRRARRRPDEASAQRDAGATAARPQARLWDAPDLPRAEAETRPDDPQALPAVDHDGLYVHAYDEDLRAAVASLDAALG